MPFIGRDWRSPGEAWVKTESLGWQRMKIIESQLHSSCHQSPTCSWPPRSEYGQHMATHCNEHQDLRQRDRSLNRDSLSSASSSDESSRAGSASPSLTNSPEKNIHQIHPITISSPYGTYSCCSHHFEVGSPIRSSLSPTDNLRNAQMTRSLSRESVLINPKQPIIHHNSTVTNYSHPCNQKSAHDEVPSNDLDNENIEQQNPQISSKSMNPPMLMKNGSKLDDKEILGCDQFDAYNSNSANEITTCCCANIKNSINSNQQQKELYVKTAPHCRISVRTREVAMYNTISEAFYRLDFCNAIHDIRRFNYICKLLHLLITQNLTSLSGCATKVLFTMLEQVAWEVSSNKRNIHVLKNLLEELRQMIQKYYCWGRPIGSSLLWQQHFDTIQRISQIVEGIELSPPKSATDQVTFDNLPAEMIREILLRLNDYKDLVNSAKASPVMRTMIDSQYIWKQLCKYHFNEQQLKMAIDSGSCRTNTTCKKGSARGIKYARTTSADGKTSFRNPVNHATTKHRNAPSTSFSVQPSSTRHQIEQTRSRRVRSGSDRSGEPSYVTRAIRIFDGDGKSTTLGIDRLDKATVDEEKTRVKKHIAQTHRELTTKVDKEDKTKVSNHSQGSEIDWERVFHHLRKKFDLKEEYADCLLLCRHCRCLFWKSFGHPCIKNEELDMRSGRSHLAERQVSRDESPQQQQALNENRISVAALSRNFDSRAQRSAAGGVLGAENIPPPACDANNGREFFINQRDNFEARLRNRHRNRVGNNNNGQNNNYVNNMQQVRSALAKDELVPKHVAVSPQAFLKFFSL